MSFFRLRLKTPLILSVLIIFILYQFLSLRESSDASGIYHSHNPPESHITTPRKGSHQAGQTTSAPSASYPSAKPIVGKPSSDAKPSGAGTSQPKLETDDKPVPSPKAKPKPKPSKVKSGDRWTREPEHFPLPQESVISLPKGATKVLPQIQAEFVEETAEEELERKTRQKSVRDALLHDWKIYKEEAWGHDEVKPVSGGSKDPFGGWGATLVDALDTLWIMDLKDEFEDAVKKVAEIDFQTTPMNTIPVFETTIRYIGGLIAAYDISEGKYPELLEKAVEIADVVYGSFDTENRMPQLHYKWKPRQRMLSPGNGGLRAISSELGSLSVEYTRLAQITGNQTYYDAIARIGNALEGYQYSTDVPGLFPQFVDATRCMRTGDAKAQKKAKEKALASMEHDGAGYFRMFKRDLWKRVAGDGDDEGDEEEAGEICEPRLENSGTRGDTFSLGALIDSLYEYLLKEYILLGDVPEANQYKEMYTIAADLIPSKILFRPNVPNNPDILFSGELKTGNLGGFKTATSHLACFAGGMFAMGSRVLNRPQDLAVGEKLTEGCVWAYGATKSGIMPEWFELQKCPDNRPCKWDEDKWYDGLVPKGWSPPPTPKTKKPKKPATKPVVKADAETENGHEKDVELKANVPPTKTEDADDEDTGSPISEKLRRLFRRGHTSPQAIEADKQSYMLKYRKSVNDDEDDDSEEPMTRSDAGRIRAELDELPTGFTKMGDSRYLLRPEAIESVWYMYRITGDRKWMDKGWKMWEAVNKSTLSSKAHSAIMNVNKERDDPSFRFENSMESFWFGETLKYFYLLFSEPGVVSLDDWVLNTEAHPFKRTKPQ